MLVAVVVSTMAELGPEPRPGGRPAPRRGRPGGGPGARAPGRVGDRRRAGRRRPPRGRGARAELGVDRARRERGRRSPARAGAERSGRRPDRDAARAARADRRCRATAADVRGAGARGGGGDRAAPGRAASRGGRDRCPATLRRRQDRGAPRGIARPAHAGDRDRGRRACAGHRLADRRGAHRAERRGGPGRRAAGRPGRQAARPLPSPGRPGRAAPRLDLARGRGPGRARRPPCGWGWWVGSESRGEVRISIDPDVPPVRADAAHLERAFANLLENALRYSGGLPVSVHVRRSGSGVVARVVDQGPGIGPAERARIFEPFYRGPASAAGSWSGSGLGLAIAKGFVEANGGTISVDSLPGQGSSFVVSLPIEQADVRRPRSPSRQPRSRRDRSAPPTRSGRR